MSLPKYANFTLDTDNNSMKQASETIKQINRQIVANLKSDPKMEAAKEAGTPPNNELEEFLANLDQINSSIVQLKTYVNESKKRELLRVADQGITPEQYKNLIEKEAHNMDMPESLKAVSLHSQGTKYEGVPLGPQIVGAGNYLFETPHRYIGGGKAQQDRLMNEAEELNKHMDQYKLDIDKIRQLDSIIETSEFDSTEFNKAYDEYAELLDIMENNNDLYPNFPSEEIKRIRNQEIDEVFASAPGDLTVSSIITTYLIELIQTHQAEIQELLRRIDEDVTATYDLEREKQALNDLIERTAQLDEDIKQKPTINKLKELIDVLKQDNSLLVKGISDAKLTYLKIKYGTDKRHGFTKAEALIRPKIQAKLTELEAILETLKQAQQQEIETARQAAEAEQQAAEAEQRLKEAEEANNARQKRIQQAIFNEAAQKADALTRQAERARQAELLAHRQAEALVRRQQMIQDEILKQQEILLKETEDREKAAAAEQAQQKYNATKTEISRSTPKVNPIIQNLTELVNKI
jgi:hypothetical protein